MPGHGDVYTCMGCRSFLTPDRSGTGWNNVANAGNYEPGKPKYYGRFNQGVVTINLVDVALSSNGALDKFWKIFDERLELCYKALMCRHNRLKGTLSGRGADSLAVRRAGAAQKRASRSISSCTAAIRPFPSATRDFTNASST